MTLLAKIKSFFVDPEEKQSPKEAPGAFYAQIKFHTPRELRSNPHWKNHPYTALILRENVEDFYAAEHFWRQEDAEVWCARQLVIARSGKFDNKIIT